MVHSSETKSVVTPWSYSSGLPRSEHRPRIFVGSQKSHELLVKVLRYSIEKYASDSVDVIPIHKHAIAHTEPKDKDNFPGTPFSFQRWMIPEICGFRGKALYLDSDMIVFADIYELLEMDMSDATIALPDNYKQTRHTSVMMVNCEKATWRIQELIDRMDAGILSYRTLMWSGPSLRSEEIGEFSNLWNSLDQYVAGTKLLHYTSMRLQPWLTGKHRDADKWVSLLLDMLDERRVTLEEISDAVRKQYIRPSLHYQLQFGIPDSNDVPPHIFARDRVFLEYCQRCGWNNVQGAYRHA